MEPAVRSEQIVDDDDVVLSPPMSDSYCIDRLSDHSQITDLDRRPVAKSRFKSRRRIAGAKCRVKTIGLVEPNFLTSFWMNNRGRTNLSDLQHIAAHPFVYRSDRIADVFNLTM